MRDKTDEMIHTHREKLEKKNECEKRKSKHKNWTKSYNTENVLCFWSRYSVYVVKLWFIKLFFCSTFRRSSSLSSSCSSEKKKFFIRSREYRIFLILDFFFLFLIFIVFEFCEKNYKRSRRLHTRRTRFEGKYTLACQSYTKQRQPTTGGGKKYANDWWNCTRLLGRTYIASCSSSLSERANERTKERTRTPTRPTRPTRERAHG